MLLEQMLRYSIELTLDDNGTLLVTCPDLSEMTSVGNDEDEALLNAVDAITTTLKIYVENKRPIPMSAASHENQLIVYLPALIAAKVLLWNTLLAQGVRKAELARQLGCGMPQIERLLDMRHSTKIELIEAALAQLGQRLVVEARAA